MLPTTYPACPSEPGKAVWILRPGEGGEGDETSMAIKFGTSGWRAIVADEFTVANIRLAVAGIAAYVKTQPEPHRVLVGRDPRFLGESFVDLAARVLAGAGIGRGKGTRQRAHHSASSPATIHFAADVPVVFINYRSEARG